MQGHIIENWGEKNGRRIKLLKEQDQMGIVG